MIYFDWIYYTNRYKDLNAAGINNNSLALSHWINHGIKENRTCNKLFENFNWKEYITKKPNLKTKNDALLDYYKQLNKTRIINKSKTQNTILLERIKKINLHHEYFNINKLLNLSNVQLNTALPLHPMINILSNPILKTIKYDNDNDVKIIICSCVYKRFELSKFCILEWLKLNVYKVVITYSFDEDYENLKDIIDNQGINRLVLVKYTNLPLSNKWNQSIINAKKFNPDAVMIMGSDDILVESYLNKVKYYINRGIDYISNNNWANVWFFSNKIMISTERYINRPLNDGLGSGRVINSNILNKINWNLYLFDKPINKCLDGTSFNKIKDFIKTKIYDIDGYAIILLKLSSDNTAITVKDNLSGYIEKVYRTNNFIKTIDNVYYMEYNN
jgi:hypothetical protein